MANRDGSNVVKVTSKGPELRAGVGPDGSKLTYIYDPAPGG